MTDKHLITFSRLAVERCSFHCPSNHHRSLSSRPYMALAFRLHFSAVVAHDRWLNSMFSYFSSMQQWDDGNQSEFVPFYSQYLEIQFSFKYSCCLLLMQSHITYTRKRIHTRANWLNEQREIRTHQSKWKSSACSKSYVVMATVTTPSLRYD